jgi:protein TonB
MSSETCHDNLPSLWPISTLVVWVVCLGVGTLGGIIPYPGPRVPADSAERLPTQVVDVKQVEEATPPPAQTPPPPDPDPPADKPPAPAPGPRDWAALPPEPAFTAVAPPSPDIAFALPTEGLTRVVDVAQASYTRAMVPVPTTTGHGSGAGGSAPPPPPSPVPAASPPVVQRLTLGEGEGNQPPPQYPREAALAQQEGTVVVRFTVGEDGRVVSADAASSCRWPLLNQAALRAVRDTWLFKPGPLRSYEVPIEFRLNR